jgi:hypothetical protein
VYQVHSTLLTATVNPDAARQANVRQLVAELLPKSLASVDCLYMLLAAFNAQYHLRVRIAYNAAGDAMDVSLHPCVLNARGPDEVNAGGWVGVGGGPA